MLHITLTILILLVGSILTTAMAYDQAVGFCVRFTNGLTAYLTGDTGIFGDMGQA